MPIFLVIVIVIVNYPTLIQRVSNCSVCRVDLAIGHGLGCSSLVIIGGSCKLFGSVALIAPFPGHKPSR